MNHETFEKLKKEIEKNFEKSQTDMKAAASEEELNKAKKNFFAGASEALKFVSVAVANLERDQLEAELAAAEAKMREEQAAAEAAEAGEAPAEVERTLTLVEE